MVKGHRVAKWEEPQFLFDRLRRYKSEQIECGPHTFFRLSESQRRVYTCDSLKEYLTNKKPIRGGKQHNNYHSVFYEFEGEKEIRIVLDITPSRVLIVTFYIVMKRKGE